MRLLACYSRCMMTLDAVGGGSNKESEMRGLVLDMRDEGPAVI